MGGTDYVSGRTTSQDHFDQSTVTNNLFVRLSCLGTNETYLHPTNFYTCGYAQRTYEFDFTIPGLQLQILWAMIIRMRKYAAEKSLARNHCIFKIVGDLVTKISLNQLYETSYDFVHTCKQHV